ncbi:MAG TPA: cytochrome c [Bacteroidales bacterium]|nr:cytochrome c [Bacteroidales bacterium]
MKTLRLFLVSLAVAAFSAAATGQDQAKPKPWPVPDEFKNMKNPVAKNDVSTKTGAVLYNKHCASCHGKTGLGNGVKARALKTFPGDFSGEEYQKQTDGEQFYKTKFGRGEMPKYEGKIPDEDIWHMVNYMRTFKK